MSASREELLVYGYIKEWHELHDIDLPPDDVILLFMKWIKLLDTFDKQFCHEKFQFHPEIDTTGVSRLKAHTLNEKTTLNLKNCAVKRWTL